MTLPQNAPTILVIGDLMIDHYLEGNSDRVSPEAPVVVVDVKKEHSVLGGAGNVVANLTALGANVHVVGVVGVDDNANKMVQLLGHALITAHLVADSDRPTTTKNRIMSMHKQVLRFDFESKQAVGKAVAQQILDHAKSLVSQVDALILSDYAKGVLTANVCQELIELAKESSIPVLIDPKGADYTKYKGATLLTPNRKELEVATGNLASSTEKLTAQAQQLMENAGLQSLIVTLSEDGLAIFDGKNAPVFISTQAREVFDVTGAGDTVLAALTYSIAQGHSLLSAAHFANTAAAVVVSKIGSATASHEEIIEFSWRSNRRDQQKVLSLDSLSQEIKLLKQAGKTIVFTNGCFDIIHAGHIQYLNAARALGDVLVVGLNSDTSVKRLKGESRPINGQDDRAAVLAGLQSVDYVVMFENDTPLTLIQTLLPSVLVKGGDYIANDIVGYAEVTEAGGEVVVVDFLEGRSSSKIISQIKEQQ